MSRDQIIDPPNRNGMNGTADCRFAAVMSGDQQIKFNRLDRNGMNGTTDCPFVTVIKTAADCPFAGVMSRDQIIDPPNRMERMKPPIVRLLLCCQETN
jgi:hypothetical protein